MPRAQRLEVSQSYASHIFLDAQRQVVFESIHALLPGGAITPARLNVHLNNRGFPDIETDCYFTPVHAVGEPHTAAEGEKT